MNWQGVDTWVVVALAVWLAGSLVFGLGMGLMRPQEGQPWYVAILAGVLVPLAAFVAYVVHICMMLAGSVLVWVALARAFPGVEAGRGRLALGLGLYALLAGALVWRLFPLDRNLAPVGAALTGISVWAPRFIITKLAAGAFVRR
jgi:hypothetical protein